MWWARGCDLWQTARGEKRRVTLADTVRGLKKACATDTAKAAGYIIPLGGKANAAGKERACTRALTTSCVSACVSGKEECMWVGGTTPNGHCKPGQCLCGV